jgi:hypothetical protein
MNTGQTMLTILALILLGTTVLTVNRNSLNSSTILQQTELGIYAVSLATSYIQRASELDWDEKTVGGLIFINIPMPQPPNIPTADATDPGLLGRDGGGELQGQDNTYDDFDDYNGFVEDTLITGVDNFHVTASVYYINQFPPYAKTTANATWLKQMDVKVNSSINRSVFEGQEGGGRSGVDTVQMSYIMGFYK